MLLEVQRDRREKMPQNIEYHPTDESLTGAKPPCCVCPASFAHQFEQRLPAEEAPPDERVAAALVREVAATINGKQRAEATDHGRLEPVVPHRQCAGVVQQLRCPTLPPSHRPSAISGSCITMPRKNQGRIVLNATEKISSCSSAETKKVAAVATEGLTPV
jgi:hypothetical protein